MKITNGAKKQRGDAEVASAMMITVLMMMFVAIAALSTGKEKKGDNIESPQRLNDACVQFSNKYHAVMNEYDDYQKLSQVQAYQATIKLSVEKERYQNLYSFWSRSEHDSSPVINSHITNKSCHDYWEYTESVLPLLKEKLSSEK